MDLGLTTQETAFRDELREWLRQNPPGETPAQERASFEHRRAWDRRLHSGGWAGVHWPVEYGGRGATLIESAIYNEELARAEAPPPVNVIGITLAGPTIMAHGSELQRERFLAPILSAEEIWCQGFSEPGAGSDLAAVATRAAQVDGGWRITGQKVWTSFAHDAKWCLLLARSDAEQPRHKGLTYFLLDMEQDAVQIRPLLQITGQAEFNEVFLEGAFVPDEHVLGGVGAGWAVAMTTLSNERSGLVFGKSFQAKILLDRLTAIADRRGLLDDAAVATRLGELHIQVEAVRQTAYRNVTSEIRYGRPGPEGSIIKWIWSETDQAVTEAAVELLGGEALALDSPWGFELLRSRGDTIESGTTEIIKNIVAERVLGLPRLH
ncbi:acyl-CoA dehydrogenase family protein [Conexibacter sp. CPCC 206217]|uniref:acyl-CoA dehydrogenase family protein n=1 Tax=Conexibacter sp. CPCC 206217 TaxID=3064574 RepID=UPI00271FACF4|nr:acyl-CoA dehydrogenase family protein [Conexibacter sp. CPCC 206217]MDO8212235.1 acyl-CoA dehydrogenase family protein [Conexibacter sp. CPCC 206217]